MDSFFLFIIENFLAFSFLILLIFTLIIYESRKGGKRIDPTELTRLINKEEGILFDLRTAQEFSSGHISGAENIQPENIEQKVNSKNISKEKPIILVCKTGSNSSKAGSTLKKSGFQNISIMSGGMMLWQNQGLPLSK
tara:strand:+ start:165 stop:578 length:414 start_codon:yes stop_codon:yes gene_type:complete